MSQDRPSAANALNTVSDFLETLLPSLEGDERFKVRVSIHLLEIVRRELENADAFDERERRGVETLLGHAGDLEALNRELAARIRSGELDASADDVFDHVLQSVEDKLRIVNPRRLAEG